MRDATRKIIPAFRAFLLWGFGAVIAFGCVLRFLKLTGVGLWYDELWTVVGASNRPFMEMYREWILGDAHPPGYFLFYFAWLKLVPSTEFWTRVPNAVAGVATVVYLLRGTKKVLTRDERIMSAAIASLSYIYVFYALSVKQYSAMLLCATIATVTYLEITQAGRVDRRSGITLGAACLALAYLNHFAMVYAWLLLALLALTFRHNSEQLRRVARIGLVYALGYLPIAYFLFIQVKYSIDDWQPYEVHSFLSELLPSMFFADPAFVEGGLGVLAAFLILAATRRNSFGEPGRNRHLAAIVVAFTGFMVALGMAKHIFFVRYFLVVLPPLFLGLGILTAAAFPIDRSWLAILPLAFFIHAAVVQYRSVEGLQRQEWDKSVDFVLKARKPEERIYVLGAKMDRTEFDYLKAGDVDGVFYVRNLKFYRYYFRRRGAYDLAAGLEAVQPTIESVDELAARFHGTGATVYVLAGHHIEYKGEALAALGHATSDIEITPMYSTLVYKLTF